MNGTSELEAKPRAGVLGAGQCFLKMLPGLRRLFELRAVFDPNPDAVGLAGLAEHERCVLFVDSEEEFDRRVAQVPCVFVLSPPAEHARQAAHFLRSGKTVFVEKPLVTRTADLGRLDEVLQTTTGRLYCSDFYVDVRAAALVAAFGKRPEHSQRMRRFFQLSRDLSCVEELRRRLGGIRSMRGRLMEGIGTAADITSRPWLRSPGGGGVILDLAYHYVGLYMALFADALVPLAVRRGVHHSNLRGPLYHSVGVTGDHAETYARILARSAAGFEVDIEVGKCWTYDERVFEIRGANGFVVVDFDGKLGAKNATYVECDTATAKVTLLGEYWDLVAVGFRAFVDRVACQNHGYAEAARTVELVSLLTELD